MDGGWSTSTRLRDDAFAASLATFISNIAFGDVVTATADYLASATLVALLKKNEDGIQTMRTLLGPNFVLPIRSPSYGLCFCEAGVQLHAIVNQGYHSRCHWAMPARGWVQGKLRVTALGHIGGDGS